jgi:hypothetical protein
MSFAEADRRWGSPFPVTILHWTSKNMKHGSKPTFVVHYLAHQMKEHQSIFLLGHGYYRASAGEIRQDLPFYPAIIYSRAFTCLLPRLGMRTSKFQRHDRVAHIPSSTFQDRM